MPNVSSAKSAKTAINLCLAVLGIVAIFANPLVGMASTLNGDTAAGGAAIYASLRVVSSVMSVAKDADIEGSLAVAAVAVSPGQVLEPVTATINRMADLLFALTLASGVLAVTLPAIASIGAVLVTLGALGKIAAPYLGSARASLPVVVSDAALRLGLVVAFVVPAAFAVAFVVGDRVTADAWTSATTVFQRMSTDLEQPPADLVPEPATVESPGAPVSPPVEKGLFDSVLGGLGKMVGQTSEAVVGAAEAAAGFAAALPDQVAENAKIVADGIAIAEDIFATSIRLGAAYLVRLIVLPALLLFGSLWIARRAFAAELPYGESEKRIGS